MLLKIRPELIKQLGWQDKEIVVINESINYIKQSEDDSIGDKRLEIIDRVIEENKSRFNSIILIKGQNIDFDNDLVNRLKSRLPNVEYEIIFLFSDLDTIFERAKKKAWFTEEDNNKDEWYNHLVDSAKIIDKAEDIKVISIDSTKGFKTSSFPVYEVHENII